MFSVQNDLNRFLKKIAAVFLGIIILDFVIGKTLEYLFFKEKINDVTYVMDRTQADMLVFGSSRAMHHYVPGIFEQHLHTSFYNCGRDSYVLIYHLAAISAVLNRYKPKRILLDFFPDEFTISEESKLSMLLPYKDNSAVRPFIGFNGKFENIKLLSHIYPYNSLFGDILSGVFLKRKNTDHNDGYIPLEGTMIYHPITKFKYGNNIDYRVRILDDFLAGLRKRNVIFTIVISPSYYSFPQNDVVVKILGDFCKKYPNVTLVNFENNANFKDSKLFNDEIHLNQTGADKFSKMLAEKLKNKDYSD